MSFNNDDLELIAMTDEDAIEAFIEKKLTEKQERENERSR
jgi:hypothetical protein